MDISWRSDLAPKRTDPGAVSDHALLRGLFVILKQTRDDEADLVAYIAKADGRKLYARQAPAGHRNRKGLALGPGLPWLPGARRGNGLSS